MAGIGKAIKGFGKAYKAWKRNKESAKIFKDAKKGKAKGEIKNKSGHVVGVPHKERSAEAIKKYHGIK